MLKSKELTELRKYLSCQHVKDAYATDEFALLLEMCKLLPKENATELESIIGFAFDLGIDLGYRKGMATLIEEDLEFDKN